MATTQQSIIQRTYNIVERFGGEEKVVLRRLIEKLLKDQKDMIMYNLKKFIEEND